MSISQEARSFLEKSGGRFSSEFLSGDWTTTRPRALLLLKATVSVSSCHSEFDERHFLESEDGQQPA